MSFLEELFSLSGRHAVVTGAASGLGRQCAVTLAKAGAAVTLIDIDKTGLTEIAKIIQGAGEATRELVIDVTQHDQSFTELRRRSLNLVRSTSWSIQPGSRSGKPCSM